MLNQTFLFKLAYSLKLLEHDFPLLCKTLIVDDIQTA